MFSKTQDWSQLWMQFSQLLISFLPLLFTLSIVFILHSSIRRLLQQRMEKTAVDNRFSQQVYTLFFAALFLVVAVLTAPINDETQGQLLSFVGLMLTAIITLSSTSIMANAMAGIMLRLVNNFKIGDYIHFAEHFGRVTEIGLFHTEIQTQDGDLCTLPNSLLTKQSVTVVSSSGTVISCNISLGYDVHHQQVESILIKAAQLTGLEDPFVYVKELGDFSVSYRISGFLTNVKSLLTVRSTLRCNVLDLCHEQEVEIVSPNYVYQRPMKNGELHTAKRSSGPEAPATTEKQSSPEELMFAKAINAESIERLKSMKSELNLSLIHI